MCSCLYCDTEFCVCDRCEEHEECEHAEGEMEEVSHD